MRPHHPSGDPEVEAGVRREHGTDRCVVHPADDPGQRFAATPRPLGGRVVPPTVVAELVTQHGPQLAEGEAEQQRRPDQHGALAAEQSQPAGILSHRRIDVTDEPDLIRRARADRAGKLPDGGPQLRLIGLGQLDARRLAALAPRHEQPAEAREDEQSQERQDLTRDRRPGVEDRPHPQGDGPQNHDGDQDVHPDQESHGDQAGEHRSLGRRLRARHGSTPHPR